MRRELTPEQVLLARELKTVRDQLKTLHDRENVIKAQLLEFLEGAEEGLADGLPLIRVIISERETFNVKALRANAAYKHVWELFRRSSVSVQVRVGDT